MGPFSGQPHLNTEELLTDRLCSVTKETLKVKSLCHDRTIRVQLPDCNRFNSWVQQDECVYSKHPTEQNPRGLEELHLFIILCINMDISWCQTYRERRALHSVAEDRGTETDSSYKVCFMSCLFTFAGLCGTQSEFEWKKIIINFH